MSFSLSLSLSLSQFSLVGCIFFNREGGNHNMVMLPWYS